MAAERMRAVLDTNVVLDLLHFADPQTLALRRAIVDGALQCFSDRPCLDELRRVSAYTRLALDGAARATLIDAYRRLVTICDADTDEDYPLPRCRDADDQKFLILAVRCRADMLLTRDRQLLRLASRRRPPPPCAILTAAAACARLADR